MKILYISPENTVGTMTLWKEIHQKNGNECEVLTMYKSLNQSDINIMKFLEAGWEIIKNLTVSHQFGSPIQF